MNDLQIIKMLIKVLGEELIWVSTDGLLQSNSFAMNKDKRVIGLNLSGNGLKVIPDLVLKLERLEKLYLGANRLEYLPESIGNLKELRELYLFKNQLKFLPESIGNLLQLIGLELVQNQLEFLPESIGNLKELRELYLSDNQIKFLPESIENLLQLIGLELVQNQLEFLPESIGNLKELRELRLSNNQLKFLPETIGNLKELMVFDLEGNQLKLLPEVIGELKGLQNLFLSRNQLKSIPEAILDIGLDIKMEYDGRTGIHLEGNPLETPPVEVVKQGNDAIRSYFESLIGERQPLNEVRVLLVGDGGAGKTSLVKRLLGKRFNPKESQTHGINIDNWNISDGECDIKVNIWDFGGQEIMHATHQFFLSKRSLYILVLDSRKDEKAEYWLKHIESFGGDSPILVVINKIDENPTFDVNRPFLRDKYKGIKSFHEVSCSRRDGIDDFKTTLTNELLKVETRKSPFAKSWFNVKIQLENMEHDYISKDEYLEICQNAGIKDDTSQETLIEFLNCLGVALHFSEFDLEETHVLQPGWVTNAVYRIINSHSLTKSEGTLQLTQLRNILKKRKQDKYNYPADKHRFIIDLMKKFELCYRIPGKETILVPELTQVGEPPFSFDYSTALKFRIDYDFLSKSIMPRFVVSMHTDVEDGLLWRTGVVLKNTDYDSRAVVKVDEAEKRVLIFVNGQQKRDYFAVILSSFRRINKSFEKIDAVEKICLPDKPHIGVSYQHLIRLEGLGQREFLPEGADKMYNVQELLGSAFYQKDEVLEYLRKIFKQGDSEDTLFNRFVDLKPNFFGFGIDINEMIREFFKKKKNI